MANKREFKKYATALGAGIAEDMLINYHCVEGLDKKTVDDSIGRVLLAVTRAVSHANIFFGKSERDFADKADYLREKKKFFKALFFKINSELEAEVEAALKVFNSAVPEEVKEKNKENL